MNIMNALVFTSEIRFYTKEKSLILIKNSNGLKCHGFVVVWLRKINDIRTENRMIENGSGMRLSSPESFITFYQQ